MQNQAIIEQLYTIGAVKTGEFILKSGAKSPIYIDLRLIISFPKLLRSVGDALWQTLKNLNFDLLCGVPYTALPIATSIALAQNIPMVMRRKEAKNYGLKRMVEGVYQAGQRCVVVEDIVTSGGSIIETLRDLRAEGLQVEHACALIDRNQGGADALKAEGCTLHTVFSLAEILNHAKQTQL